MANLLGLMGEHLSHSLSPIIHKEIFNLLNYEAYYHLFEVDKGDVQAAIEGIKALKIKGVNVTIPYKERVMEYLDEISEEAKNIGAINTICVEDGYMKGYNTDYYGFAATLDKYNVGVKNKTIVILGTGGASKAVVQCTLDREAYKVIFVSRKPIDKPNYITYEELSNLGGGDVIINCTPVGMYPNTMNSPVNKDIIVKFRAAIDLIYNPYKTKFLSLAEENGLTAVNGLYMLVSQAIKSEELWNNIKIDEEIVDKIYRMLVLNF